MRWWQQEVAVLTLCMVRNSVRKLQTITRILFRLARPPIGMALTMGGRIICALPPKSLHFTCVQNQIKIRDQDEWDGETKGGQEKAKNWFDRMDGKIEEIRRTGDDPHASEVGNMVVRRQED